MQRGVHCHVVTWSVRARSLLQKNEQEAISSKEGDSGVRLWVVRRQFPGSQEGQEVLAEGAVLWKEGALSARGILCG